MRIAKRAGIWIVFLVLIASMCKPAAADDSGSRWFPLTGHFVQGQFLDFYQSAPDPLVLFGYPLTEAFADQTGQLTQYFQRARFDLKMTEKGPEVTLAPLGWMLNENNGAPANFLEDPLSCRLFPATGKNVCYAFLQFYDSYHGETYFGNPISGAEIIDGRIVQYFDNVRMEYDNNLPEGHRVTLTMLGKVAVEKWEPPSRTRQPENNTLLSSEVDSLSARAFVQNSLVSHGMTQTVFLVVQDQDLRPVQGVQASVTTFLPDGSKSVYRPKGTGVTGKDGILRIDVPVDAELTPGQVVTLEITAEYGGMKVKAATWFRIWY
jgi:hypothetical protein